MKLDGLSSVAIMIPNGNSKNATNRPSINGFNGNYDIVTTTKSCSAGVWTVRVCNSALPSDNGVNHTGIMTRSCAVRSLTQSQLNFASPPKMIIKLFRQNGSKESYNTAAPMQTSLVNGQSCPSPTQQPISSQKDGVGCRRKPIHQKNLCGRSGKRRKSSVKSTNGTTSDYQNLNDHNHLSSIASLDSLQSTTTVAAAAIMPTAITSTYANTTAVNGTPAAAVNGVANHTAAAAKTAITNGTSNHSAASAAACSQLSGDLSCRKDLKHRSLRHVRRKKMRTTISKPVNTAITPSSSVASTQLDNGSSSVKNSLMTDFFPVRRSSRTTSAQIKKREKEKMEQFVLSEREDGFKVEQIADKGRGVITKRCFSRGEYLVEYAGELVDHAVAKEREARYSLDQRLGCYMYYFTYKNRKYCIDATAETPRLGRLINHSRLKPNCATKIIELDGQPRLILVALHRIEPAEELLYDYGDRDRESLGSHPWLAF